MKKFLGVIITVCTLFGAARAQTDLYNKTWKVRQISTSFRGSEKVFYQKDSLANAVDYSATRMAFYTNGTYRVNFPSDTALHAGVWSFAGGMDSLVIDSVSFKLVQLDAANLVTRGYSLAMIEASGTVDTIYQTLFLYATNSEPQLPVTLSGFTGRFEQRRVVLNWTTAAEVNNKQFEIEHSTNDIHFERIGTVPGKGTTNEPGQYIFPTTAFRLGKNYYRLKQSDFDGNDTYSPVIMVNVDEAGRSSISLYPNPATKGLLISLKMPAEGPLQFRLSDLQGRFLWQKTLPGNSGSLPVDLPLLAKGIYVVTILNAIGEKLLTDRLVLQ